MKIKATKVPLEKIQKFRSLFLQANNMQIRYDACHKRNWIDSWLLTLDGVEVGYGSVKGKDRLADRDAIFEFYVLPTWLNKAHFLFTHLLEVSKVQYLECQTNDFLMSSMMYEFARNISSDTILFEDHFVTNFKQPEIIFRFREKEEKIFTKEAGEYVLEKEGEVVATGGFLLHYNFPFADLYMEVHPKYRQQGLGTYIIQELKKACYRAGRVPAARCNIKNKASKATLIKAGLRVCGYMLLGKLLV